jgi:PBSX family phage terminase large subunit
MTMTNNNIDVLYSQLQQEVLKFAINNDFFMLINHGAKRSGKTIIDNDLFLLELKRVRKEADKQGVKDPQYILAGADLSSIQRNVLNELTNKYNIQFKFDKYNRFNIFGVLVCCFGHSKINDLGRIRGMTAWGAYINEATVANEQVFDEIKSRCSAPGARLIMDTNPDRPGHWLKQDYIDKADGRTIAEYHWRLTDNTFLTQRYIDSIKASTPSGVFYDRDINGAWVSADGVVYPDFDRNIHYITTDDVPEIVKFWAGMDFGWEHHGAIALFGRSENGTNYLLKEWSAQHRDINDWIKIIQKIQSKIGEFTIYCDSARPDLINDMQCADLNAVNAHKDVIAGIGTVATLLKNRNLFVVRENVSRFDEEIDTYCWKSGADEPVKQNDDVMDAVRYGIYSEKVENETEAKINNAPYLIGGW